MYTLTIIVTKHFNVKADKQPVFRITECQICRSLTSLILDLVNIQFVQNDFAPLFPGKKSKLH